MIPPKIEPWKHQAEVLDHFKDFPAAALHWEPRVGKSKVTIDNVVYLAESKKADAAVVLAPNGVHLNWTREELPLHWPFDHELFKDTVVVEWDSARATTRKFREMLFKAAHHPGFVWVAANAEAIPTDAFRKFMVYFASKRKAVLIVDEAHIIKNPSAHRTKVLTRIVWPGLFKKIVPGAAPPVLKPTFPYRRELTGTPVGIGPFDMWSQYRILDPDLLGRVFTTFKARYSVMKKNRSVVCPHCQSKDKYREVWRSGKRFVKCLSCDKVSPVFGPLYDELVEYRNLEELSRLISPITSRKKKKECLDLPERMMKKLKDGTMSEVLGIPHRFCLSPEQRRVYDEMRDDLVARLSSGEEISAPMALTNLLRLQQISRGHITLPDGGVRTIDGGNPAVESAVQVALENPGKSIFWCRFTADVDNLIKAFTSAGIGCIRGDATVDQKDRPELRKKFRDDPSFKSWVGTIGAGGVGVDLGAADLMVFFSHGFDLIQRLQALERNYGSTQKAEKISVLDFVASDTVDEKSLASYERKEDLASRINGDRLRQLLLPG